MGSSFVVFERRQLPKVASKKLIKSIKDQFFLEKGFKKGNPFCRIFFIRFSSFLFIHWKVFSDASLYVIKSFFEHLPDSFHREKAENAYQTRNDDVL